jgi:phytoene dehydrogenase-like protein
LHRKDAKDAKKDKSKRSFYMKSIIIIGSGMGGLSAGIYAQLNGFQTRIFEAHSLPGGQCTSWKRKGYVFDGCLHHFGAGSGQTKMDAFWREVGALPAEMLPTTETAGVLFPDGTCVRDYYDLEQLRAHLLALSPQDAPLIAEYLHAIRLFQRKDTIGALYLGSPREKLDALPSLFGLLKYFPDTLGKFALRFKHPQLRQAFALLHSSVPGFPLFLHLAKHATLLQGDLAWPRGGALTIARNMAARYQQLGGKIACNQKVVKILVEQDRARGVELADGSQHFADFVISNADGRKTILQMLEGHYINPKIARYCQPGPDVEVPFAVQVFLGVKRDLSSLPAALVVFLEQPVTLAGVECPHLDLQLYGADPSMAPAGKGVIKVELFARPSYFAQLSADPAAYAAEKSAIAAQVIRSLEAAFPGLSADVEEIDVTTLHTWEHFMGGTDGHTNFPNKPFVIVREVFGLDQRYTLPGLKNFFMTGQWVTSAGALFMNALSGKTAVRKICRECGVKFTTPSSPTPLPDPGSG